MSLLEKDKRKFSVIIGSKKCGACSGASPSGAARKVKGKRSEFYLKETTKGSKKKLYGPYSSKKKVVQRGGELKNLLREQICKDILAILTKCNKPDELTGKQQEYNEKFKVLETSYKKLAISHRTNKCITLINIIGTRNSFWFRSDTCSLVHCLCLNMEEQMLREFAFFNDRKDLILQYVLDKINYYENHWIKFIEFIRNTVNIIEFEIREREKRSNAKLAKIQKGLEQEENARYHAAQAGPAEEELNFNNSSIRNPKPPSYFLTNNKLRKLDINPNGSSVANLRTNPSQIPQRMLQPVGRRNIKPTQPPHNSQKPLTRNLQAELAALLQNNNNSQKPQQPQQPMSNLEARLAATLLNNNSQKPQQPMSNLEARLAALRND